MITFQAALRREQHPVLGPVAHRLTIKQCSAEAAESVLELRGAEHHAAPIQPGLVRLLALTTPGVFETPRL